MSDEPESKAKTEAEVEAAPRTSGVPSSKKWLLFSIVSILSLVADQVTKIWARADLPVFPADCKIPEDMPSKCIGVPVEVIESFWHWRLSMNPGSAFGLFSSQGGARVFLSIIGVAAVIGMFWMLRKSRPDQKVLHWALAFIAGGAVGNLIDRIYYGVVTDFILWHVGEFKPGAHESTGRWEHEWPVFNIADVVLVVGVGFMFIDMWQEGKREKAQKLAKKAARDARARKQGLVKDFNVD